MTDLQDADRRAAMRRAMTGGELAGRSQAERLAIWTVRRLGRGPQSCAAAPATLGWGRANDLQAVAEAFRALPHPAGGGGLELGCPGALALTRHEQKLLRALAAAQSGDDAVADNFLASIAPGRQVRATLGRAVQTLAAALGLAGHWLPQPRPANPLAGFALPAPALRVARTHGMEPGRAVAWPSA